MQIEVGEVLGGKYRVDRVLGAGGMGVVVAATDQTLERKVAIKLLHTELAGDPHAATRFLREARAAAKIHGEHVVRVIEVETTENGTPFMVMEFLEGEDLQQRALRGPIPIEEICVFVLEACEAIAEAHAAGIVHRDLKPANLFVARRPDGSSCVKVLDFGISKSLSPTDPGLTKTASMMGSPLYMSPEQMRSAKDVDLRTDIWSLGAILYELLAGEPPFNADTMPGLIALVLEQPPPALRDRRPDVSERLNRIVTRALAKNRADRYQSVAELAADLGDLVPESARVSVQRIVAILGPASIHSVPPEEPPRPSGSTVANTAASWGGTRSRGEPERRARQVGIGLGAVAVALLVVVAVVGLRFRSGGGPGDDAATPAASVVSESVTRAPAEGAAAVAAPEDPVVSASTVERDAGASRKPAAAATAAVTPGPKGGRARPRPAPPPAPSPQAGPPSRPGLPGRKFGGRK